MSGIYSYRIQSGDYFETKEDEYLNILERRADEYLVQSEQCIQICMCLLEELILPH